MLDIGFWADNIEQTHVFVAGCYNRENPLIKCAFDCIVESIRVSTAYNVQSAMFTLSERQ